VKLLAITKITGFLNYATYATQDLALRYCMRQFAH